MVAAVGRTLIAAGVLILLFVAYQLWGTNFYENRAQRDLKDDFSRVLAADVREGGRGRRAPGGPTTTVPLAPPEGEAVALMRIPKIGLEKAVVEGVSLRDLKKAPGHYPDTPLPGQPGNAAIAGHRTTYGAPFWSLDELAPGDRIEVTTRQGRFFYEVTGSQVVRPSDVHVLDPTDDNRLTLTTCHPRFSASRRLIVTATLTDEPAPAPPTTAPPPDTRPLRRVVAEDAGLSGEGAANGPTVLWGAVCALIWLAAWAVGRWWGRPWMAQLVAAPVFFAALFVFFENVARLLPANV